MQEYVCDICGERIEPIKVYILKLRPRFKVAHNDPAQAELDLCPRCARGFAEAIDTDFVMDLVIIGDRRRA